MLFASGNSIHDIMVEERKTWQGVISLIAVLALSLDISFSSWWTTLSIGVSQWTLCNIVSGLTQWAFPSVVTVFGSIFLSPARHIKMKVLWQRFIPAALFSCAVWWLSTSVVTMHNNHPQDLDFLTFRECMVESLEAPAFIGFCHMGSERSIRIRSSCTGSHHISSSFNNWCFDKFYFRETIRGKTETSRVSGSEKRRVI